MGSLFWSLVALFFGWTVYAYWWREVILSQEIEVFIGLLIALVIAIVTIGAATALWILHNQRLARRGGRGLSTRLFTREFEKDGIGRTIEMPARAELTTSARIVIRANGLRKTYSVEPSEEQAAAS